MIDRTIGVTDVDGLAYDKPKRIVMLDETNNSNLRLWCSLNKISYFDNMETLIRILNEQSRKVV